MLFQNHNLISGLTLFSFSDKWWKAGNPDQQDIGGLRLIAQVFLMTEVPTKNIGG